MKTARVISELRPQADAGDGDHILIGVYGRIENELQAWCHVDFLGELDTVVSLGAGLRDGPQVDLRDVAFIEVDVDSPELPLAPADADPDDIVLLSEHALDAHTSRDHMIEQSGRGKSRCGDMADAAGEVTARFANRIIPKNNVQ